MRLSTLTVYMFILFGTAFCEDRWDIFSDYRDIKEIKYMSNTIWCATSGGLAAFHLNTREYSYHNYNDGLQGIGISAMTLDDNNGLWLGFDNNTLQRYEPDVGITHSVNGLIGASGLFKINDIHFSDQGVFVATNRGVSRITYSAQFDRWVWFEEYLQLGNFPSGIEAKAIWVSGNFLWIGTEIGLARADLSTPVPKEWDNYTVSEGLRGNEIRDIVEFHDEIHVVTEYGMSVFRNGLWSTLSTNTDIRKISVVNDSLRSIRHLGVNTWNGLRWELSSIPRNWVSTSAWDGDGRVWGGMMFDNGAVYRGGLVEFTDSAAIEHIPNGPVSNHALDFAFQNSGNLLMVGGHGTGHHGLSIWNGSFWKLWSAPDNREPIFFNQNRSVMSDQNNGIWVGTWGGGLGYYLPDSTIKIYDSSEESGHRLMGYSGRLDKVLIGDIEEDQYGNIWLLNRSAIDGNVLVCIQLDYIQTPAEDKDWHYFHRSLFRNYPHFDKLAIDDFGRKWIGSTSPEVIDGKGVYAFDDNGTPGDDSDDRSWGPFPGLESPQVFSIKNDPQGYIWVGTVDGAYYINTNTFDLASQSFTPLHPLRDNQVNAIEVDVSGKKWFGTTQGVIVVEEDFFTVNRLITTQHPDRLPDKNVRAIAINPYTGWAYFGTDNGTAALFTPYRDYGEEITEITIEPNPFNPNLGKLMFTGNSLADQAEASIFTPDGRLVRHLSHDQAAYGWDGTNNYDDKVASGVYIIVTYNNSGKSARSKIAVIWK